MFGINERKFASMRKEVVRAGGGGGGEMEEVEEVAGDGSPCNWS